MRRLITGVDSRGESCVVNEIIGAPLEPRTFMETIFEAADASAMPRPPGKAALRDLSARGHAVAVGGARWLDMRWAPGIRTPMHHTDTIDFVTILEGRADLILDDGAHRLEPGDCVVITGVDHSWATGPEGCAVIALLIGTPSLPG